MSVKSELVIVQRYFYNFREGFFNHLYSVYPNFKLINSLESCGRVKVHSDKAKNNYTHQIWSFNLSKDIVIFPFLFFTLLKLKPKVIITEGGQNTINNIQIRLFNLLYHKPFIIWDLGKGYKNFRKSLARKIYMSIYTSLIKKASLVYGYNTSSSEYFRSLSVDPEKIIVLNNTVDTITLKRIIDQSTTKMPSDLKSIYSSKKKFIIFVGSLLPTKNIEHFSEIMSKLDNDYHLLIIGSGKQTYEENLKRLFKGLNISFLGYKRPEELLPYYKIASFCILPGLGGLTINQSMAFGVPVLCTKADGAEKDLIQNALNGFIYNNIDELVDFIHSKSSPEWKEMGLNAKKILYTQFSLELQIEKFLNGIDLVLNGK